MWFDAECNELPGVHVRITIELQCFNMTLDCVAKTAIT